MKLYTKEKFEELSLLRKSQICLNIIYFLEKNWENEDLKNEKLSLLKDYFLWFNFLACDEEGLKRLHFFKDKITDTISERTLLDLAVPLERFSNQSIKDEQIFNITFKDDNNKKRLTFPICFVLDHLRSAFNVGSIFRMAECLGVEKIYLVGYTPTPDDESVKKTSMGTDESVPWTHFQHMSDVIRELKNQEIQLIGLETAKEAKNISEIKVEKKIALFVGNERFGLSEGVLEQMDLCTIIPMMGTKNSLNVAQSLAIATYEVSRQFQ